MNFRGQNSVHNIPVRYNEKEVVILNRNCIFYSRFNKIPFVVISIIKHGVLYLTGSRSLERFMKKQKAMQIHFSLVLFLARIHLERSPRMINISSSEVKLFSST